VTHPSVDHDRSVVFQKRHSMTAEQRAASVASLGRPMHGGPCPALALATVVGVYGTETRMGRVAWATRNSTPFCITAKETVAEVCISDVTRVTEVLPSPRLPLNVRARRLVVV
jgi:hypothetical protein